MNSTSVQNNRKKAITAKLWTVETQKKPRKFYLLYSNHKIDFYCFKKIYITHHEIKRNVCVY